MDTIRIVPGSQQGPGGVVPPEPSPPGDTKFFVVDSVANTTFRYASDGTETGSFPLDVVAQDPTGATSNAAGDAVWVIDGTSHHFAVHGPDGSFVGSWLAMGLENPQGIATDGSDLWVVDARTTDDATVLHYPVAAGYIIGAAVPTGSFSLHPDNISPTGIATDGATIWVTDDGLDEVFVYQLDGVFTTRWGLDAENSDPSGSQRDSCRLRYSACRSNVICGRTGLGTLCPHRFCGLNV